MKTKTKKATPKMPKRSKHTILLTSRIETRPMTDAEAKALVGTIKTELDAAFAMIPEPEALKGKCATASTEATIMNKDDHVAVVGTKSFSAIMEALDEVDIDLSEIKESLRQLHTTFLDDVSDKIDGIDDEVSDMENSVGELEYEIKSVFRTL